MQVGVYQLLAPLSVDEDVARYKGVDTQTDTPVEVRLLRLDEADVSRREAIHKRLAMAALVESPAARGIETLELDADPPHLVLEWLDDSNLLEQQSADHQLAPGEAITLACQLAGGLVAAHRVGFVHGALTPHNLRQRADEQWTIDFTLPTLPDRTNDDSSSAGFRAAEACRGEAEPASDVFSVTAILYWGLFGRRVQTTGETDPDALAEEVSSIDQLRPQASELGSLLAAGLAADPSERPDAAGVAAQLESITQRLVGGSAVASPNLGQTQVMAGDSPDDGRFTATMATEIKPAVAAAESIPAQLGRFQIAEKLGEGGMGSVYRGEDLADGKSVAVKVLSNHVAKDDQSRRRFAKEARVLARIQSPYVANLIEFNDDGGTDYLAIEFVPGSNLAELLEERKSLNEEAALALMVDVARGLTLAHSRGVVHRDIKPDNVLLTDEGLQQIRDGQVDPDAQLPLAKLTDFGLARSLEQTESLAITRQGSVMGTPFYMPPEQCRGEATDARSDVYSMGATLFHLLAGEPPYVADTHIGVLNKHCHDPVPSLAKFKPAIGSGVEQVVEKTLAKNPDARYTDAEALLVDLENLLHGKANSLAIHPRVPDRDSGKTLEFEFTWTLTSSAAQLWPFVANTDRLNQAMGLPSAHFSTRVDPERGVRRFAETRIAGQRIAWEEHPFEWIEGRRMSVLRQFTHGPFAWFVNVVELTPQADGRTLLTHKVLLEPRNLLGRIIAKIEIGMKAKRSLTRIYQQIDGFIAGGKHRDPTADAFRKPATLNPRRRNRMLHRLDRLRDLEVDAAVIDTLGQFLEYGSDQEVARIRPRVFAERFDLDPDQVVTACLYAVREGLLALLWDILCPSCRIPADVQETLSALEDHGHCEACNVDFDLDFSNSIEMIFRVHPEIRDVEVATYCIGGPAFSAHVVAQSRIAPAERFELDLSLPEGAYRLRGPQLPYAVDLRTSPAGSTGRWDMTLSKPPPRNDVPTFQIGSQVITLLNDGPTELLVRLERTVSRDDAITAGDASALPLFRELLPGQVLSPGQMVSMATVTIVRVELDRAAELYGELGDGPAFGLIRDALVALEACVIRGGGAVVKLVAEGMLATFADPVVAIQAAFELESALERSSPERSLGVRTSLHRGPAMVTTLNDRLDYFGTTVHVVSQLLELAQAGDVIITDAIADSPDVGQVIAEAGRTVEVILTDLPNVIVQRCVRV
jgi:serine/threonine protein kinase/class 3 adenylate cyclase